MQDVSRPATDREIATMRGLLKESIAAGAIGFSTGLFYPASRAAPMDEVLAVVEVLRGTGAVYTTHMRDEADGVEESLEESFETARQAGVPLVISHHKCVGTKNFGRSSATLKRIDHARKYQRVGLDVYPYTAGSSVLLPEFVEYATRVIITWSTPYPETAGRDLSEIAKQWNLSEIESAKRLSPAGGVYFMMDESDVQRILAYEQTMIGSDGLPHDHHPHPRLWGTFPRVLGRYVRELGILTLEDAVYRMTGLAADQFGLTDRGQLRPGAYADLVIFDPATISDRATFESPKQPAAGIDMVMVAGEIIYRYGKLSEARPGKMLRRTQA
jgi:N-acyl-D-amino-acid deacylase